MTDSIEERFQTLHEIVKAARAGLDRNAWDYLVGGADTETSLARNRQALDSIAFRPRVLRDVSSVDCSGGLFGKRLRIPVLLAPVGSSQVFDPDGGAAAADGARAFGNGFLLSSASQPSLEAAAAKAGDCLKIFQLYVRGDDAWVEEQIRRVIDAGYDALCITVDTAYVSRRERDIAKRYGLVRRSGHGLDFQAKVSWRDIERYKAKLKLPLMLKGIATAEDAVLALERGVEAIYVSNHGGRQLDHCLGSVEVLPEIIAAVGGHARIIVDGSISRGTDVVKAIALGADAVGVGRLYVYGMAAAGSAGIVRVLELLEEEIRLCLGLLGVTRFAALDKSYLCPAKPVTAPTAHSAWPLLDFPRDSY
jgi:isopentenyl diphosphate isomerase/L-lactate dehydrogenase-like FMN-dependent dehydrogenase